MSEQKPVRFHYTTGPMGLLNTLTFITQHPLNSGHRAAALWRFGAWQVRSRIAGSPVPINFVDDTQLLLSRGQTGATGNLYTGLHEFEEMAFVLHFLRPGDLFADVGANVGAYTVLAGGAAGADCVAFEPAPAAFAVLIRNVEVNHFVSRARLVQSAVGAAVGKTLFTVGRDTLNRVDSEASEQGSIEVTVTTLDEELRDRVPALIKIDVEGFEAHVLDGASLTLADHRLGAVIMETNGSGVRYSASDRDLHDRMMTAGFTACTYSPFSRTLTQTDLPQSGGNTLYVRDLEAARTRVTTAPTFRIAGRIDL
jgi:methyltransferase, FkbM family